ncbi:hypothetical protein IC575_030126 [Cucumis melo]
MASSETDPFSSSNPTASSENNSFSTFPLPSSEHDAYSNSAASSDDLRSASPFCMHKFRLYETRSKFYMVGRNKNRTYWRVLKIDRMDLSELNIREDSAVYTETECSDLLRRIHEGNKSTGGLKFVSTCYGIVGFIKFLGPYYMLLITKRCQIGTICGHPIYGVSRSEMIPLSNAAVLSRIAISKTENRFLELSLGKTIGIARHNRGLYLLDDDAPSRNCYRTSLLSSCFSTSKKKIVCCGVFALVTKISNIRNIYFLIY